MKEGFRRTYLKEVKEKVVKDEFAFLGQNSRKKNVDFMREHFLDHCDLKEIILDLTPSDCVGGPEPDRDGYEGQILKFKSTYLDNVVIYIKFRYNPPDELVFISFHEDE